MSLRKTMTAVVLAGAFATAPMLAYGQAQYLEKGGTPGTASASGQEKAGAAAMGGLTAGTIAAGVAVAAAIAVAIAAASDDGDATTTTSTSTSTSTGTGTNPN